jgi:hypothetical protein
MMALMNIFSLFLLIWSFLNFESECVVNHFLGDYDNFYTSKALYIPMKR